MACFPFCWGLAILIYLSTIKNEENNNKAEGKDGRRVDDETAESKGYKVSGEGRLTLSCTREAVDPVQNAGQAGRWWVIYGGVEEGAV